MVQAAWLHDVVEDTGIGLVSIKLHFGQHVHDLVEQLTDVSVPSDGNREVRKRIDREAYRDASPEAQTIKLADIISNTSDIVKHDPDFAKVYLREKRLLLPYLAHGDQQLFDRVCELLTG